MADGRRWRNLGEANQTVFITTTVQGFTPVFSQAENAQIMTLGMLADLEALAAAVYGFVVMPEHVHLLVRLPSQMSASRLVNILKSKAARRILPIIDDKLRTTHEANRTLKDRVLWQRSFRSVIVDAEWAFVQKLDYIHSNPVKRGLCQESTEYRWSSAWLWDAGMAREERTRTCDVLQDVCRWFATPRGGAIAASRRGRT